MRPSVELRCELDLRPHTDGKLREMITGSSAPLVMQHYTEGAMKSPEYDKPAKPYLPAKKSKRDRNDDDHDHGKDAGGEPAGGKEHGYS